MSPQSSLKRKASHDPSSNDSNPNANSNSDSSSITARKRARHTRLRAQTVITDSSDNDSTTGPQAQQTPTPKTQHRKPLAPPQNHANAKTKAVTERSHVTPKKSIKDAQDKSRARVSKPPRVVGNAPAPRRRTMADVVQNWEKQVAENAKDGFVPPPTRAERLRYHSVHVREVSSDIPLFLIAHSGVFHPV
ncbi:MAG: hypothetical protein Q9174_003271, partial [Haloplaca sp. 1 TL-2023]